MALFEHHVFVCCNERPDGHPRGCCSASQSVAIRDALKEAAAAAGLKGRVRVNQAGCLDQCELGPTIVVYPDQVWYGGVTPADVPEIVREHLVGGRPVERLRLTPDQINPVRKPAVQS